MDFTRPVRFPGSDEEIEANRRTHFFTGDELRCADCDCRMFGTLATWPCGDSVPTETVSNDAAPLSAWEAIVRSR